MNWFRKKSGKTEHERISKQLSAYLDDELADRERAAVERHLDTCADCRWDLATLRQTVQWTQSLPTVPLPRVFTIPAPAEAARAYRPSWRVPVLQGATALVALLLVFAFVGDFALTGIAPGEVSRPVAVMEQQALDVAATQPAEAEATILLEIEAAPPPTGEEVVAEKAAAEPSEPPAVAEDVPSEGVRQEEAPPASAESEARGLGAGGFETPTEAPMAVAVSEDAQEAPAPVDETDVATTGEAEAYGAEAPPTVAPTVPVTREAPTLVAKADEPAGVAAAGQVEMDSQEAPAQDYGWLRTAEVGLGILFIALAGTTAVVMIHRRQLR